MLRLLYGLLLNLLLLPNLLLPLSIALKKPNLVCQKITATAHKLARIFYHLWKYGDLDPGADYYQQKYKERAVRNLKKTAKSLDLDVVEQPTVQEVS